MGNVVSINKNKPEYLGLGIYFGYNGGETYGVYEIDEDGDIELTGDLTLAHYYLRSMVAKRVHDFIMPNLGHAETKILTFLLNRTYMEGYDQVNCSKHEFRESLDNTYIGLKLSRVSIDKALKKLKALQFIVSAHDTYLVSIYHMNEWLKVHKKGLIYIV